MKVIHKKILLKYFEDVAAGNKRFEIRKDEDSIEKGDIIVLAEWNDGVYTGEEYYVEVKYVLRDVPEYGLEKGYCIFCW